MLRFVHGKKAMLQKQTPKTHNNHRYSKKPKTSPNAPLSYPYSLQHYCNTHGNCNRTLRGLDETSHIIAGQSPAIHAHHHATSTPRDIHAMQHNIAGGTSTQKINHASLCCGISQHPHQASTNHHSSTTTHTRCPCVARVESHWRSCRHRCAQRIYAAPQGRTLHRPHPDTRHQATHRAQTTHRPCVALQGHQCLVPILRTVW